VGYYISEANRKKEVITPGGGGDYVKYFPHGQLEPAIQKVLSNKFKRVYSLNSPSDRVFIEEKGISFVFTPSIGTSSFSKYKYALYWSPTHFTVVLKWQVIDFNDRVVWNEQFEDKGEAHYPEFLGNTSLSAQKASENAFWKFQEALDEAQFY